MPTSQCIIVLKNGRVFLKKRGVPKCEFRSWSLERYNVHMFHLIFWTTTSLVKGLLSKMASTPRIMSPDSRLISLFIDFFAKTIEEISVNGPCDSLFSSNVLTNWINNWKSLKNNCRKAWFSNNDIRNPILATEIPKRMWNSVLLSNGQRWTKCTGGDFSFLNLFSEIPEDLDFLVLSSFTSYIYLLQHLNHGRLNIGSFPSKSITKSHGYFLGNTHPTYFSFDSFV